MKKYKDVHTGDIYGKWIVLDENDFEQKKGYRKILCECQCVNKTKRYIDERNLKNGTSVSCGKCGYKFIECGDRFGEWTTLESETTSDEILCRCSCGTEKKVNKFNLNRGISTNCGCISTNNHFAKNQFSDVGEKILIGNKYNKWTVLEQVKTASYLCECSCFNHTKQILSRSALLGNRRKGCKKCRLMKDHIGETHNYLTILSIDEETTIQKGRIYVYAKCKCGDVHSYEQNTIIRGRVVSCGCKKHEIDMSMIGKKFGHLTVQKLIGRKYIDNTTNSYIEWECLCDCGNTKIVRQGNLLHGSTWSCGCMKRSHGEELIYKYLKKNHFLFKEQYRIDDCRNILPLPFDFALFNSSDKLLGLVEFDGQQHFEPFQFEGCDVETSVLNFEQCVERDSIKTDYCKKNHIPLLRITYEDLEDGNWIYLLWDFLYSLKLIVDIDMSA